MTSLKLNLKSQKQICYEMFDTEQTREIVSVRYWQEAVYFMVIHVSILTFKFSTCCDGSSVKLSVANICKPLVFALDNMSAFAWHSIITRENTVLRLRIAFFICDPSQTNSSCCTTQTPSTVKCKLMMRMCGNRTCGYRTCAFTAYTSPLMAF